MDGSRPIVLVEDNQDDVDLTLRALKRNNISNDLLVANDGVEALDLLLGERPVMPALILLDLKLPKVSGMEVLEQLRSERRTRLLPIVILTSSQEDDDVINGYTLGANSYIRKPVEFDRFVEAVRHLGLYWLLLNQSPPLEHPDEPI